MSKIEDLLRRALHAEADRVEPRPTSWEALEVSTNARSSPRLHLIIVGSVAVLAAGAIVGFRILGDGAPQGLSVAPPVSSPTAEVSFPVETSTPTEEPTATAQPSAPQEKSWTSPDGVWTVSYPNSWYIKSAGSDRWNITSFKPGTSDGSELSDGEFKITLSISDNTQGWTLDELLNFYCDGAGDPELKTLECGKVEYGGKTWAWARAHDDVSGGNTDTFAGYIRDGRIYQAVGIVPDGAADNTGEAAVDEIFLSFEVD